MARTGLSLFWRSSTWRLRYLREYILVCSPLLMSGAEGRDFRSPAISFHFRSFSLGWFGLGYLGTYVLYCLDLWYRVAVDLQEGGY